MVARATPHATVDSSSGRIGARMIPHAAAIRALTKVLILPFDILIGLIKSRKAGFLRFFGHYTRTWVVRT